MVYKPSAAGVERDEDELERPQRCGRHKPAVHQPGRRHSALKGAITGDRPTEKPGATPEKAQCASNHQERPAGASDQCQGKEGCQPSKQKAPGTAPDKCRKATNPQVE